MSTDHIDAIKARDMSGLSHRQLYFWHEKGYINSQLPKGQSKSGVPLYFTRKEVKIMKFMKILTDIGLGAKEASEVARTANFVGDQTYEWSTRSGAVEIRWRV